MDTSPAPERTARPAAPRTSPDQRRRGRRPTLSVEIVVAAAVELMDAEGESALTLRSLAARLDTGVGSLYHYVEGRDQLLDLATDAVLGGVFVDLDLPDDPYAALRTLSDRLYEAMTEHRWTASYLMRDTGMQPNSMRVFDLFGRQVQRLDLSSRQRFTAVSSLVSFVVGAGAELQELPEWMMAEEKTQGEHLHDFAEAWRALDPVEFPFMHEIADEFEVHDDVQQFRDGVDLFLAGIAAQVAEGVR